MTLLVLALSTLPIIALLLWRLWPEVAELTLRSAWAWSVAAFACVVLSVIGEFRLSGLPAAARSSLHYLTATMLLAPLMAVLGARRPGANAWPWFVVLPLILVLQWPAVSQLMTSSGREPIEIGTPATLGVLLVLLMGFGNYFGTRNTLAVTLISGAVLCSLMPATGWISADSSLPQLTPVLLVVALVLARRRADQLQNLPNETVPQSVDRLWLTFRDYYGIVWAKRVMDRVNQFALRERWSVQLTLDGFAEISAPEGNRDARYERPIAILCWILKRFAADTWLAAMLKDAFPATHLREDV